MVLPDEQKLDKYPLATLEDSKLNTEQKYYSITPAHIVDASSVSGLLTYTNDNGIGNNPSDLSFESSNSEKLYRLNGSPAVRSLRATDTN